MKKGLTRRNMLKTSTAAIGAVAGAGLLKGFPAIHAADAPVIRYLGTAVNMGDAVQKNYLMILELKLNLLLKQLMKL
jgi:putative spermidine/putrescine transport system substrate-binding protein